MMTTFFGFTLVHLNYIEDVDPVSKTITPSETPPKTPPAEMTHPEPIPGTEIVRCYPMRIIKPPAHYRVE